MQELWILDETESTSGFVSNPEVLTVHIDNSGCLSCTIVNCTIEKVQWLYEVMLNGNFNQLLGN